MPEFDTNWRGRFRRTTAKTQASLNAASNGQFLCQFAASDTILRGPISGPRKGRVDALILRFEK